MLIGTLPIYCGEDSSEQMWTDFFDFGSFLSKEEGTWAYAETIAYVKMMCFLYKIANSLFYETLPGQSVDLLSQWSTRLNVPYRYAENPATLRRYLAIRYRLPLVSSALNLQNMCIELLEEDFLGIEYNYGTDLDNPPIATYDAYCNPVQRWNYDSFGNPVSIKTDVLSDDYQISERYHLTVVINENSDLSEAEQLYLISTPFKIAMNNILPSYCTWDWTLETSLTRTGFIIGDSLLGYKAL